MSEQLNLDDFFGDRITAPNEGHMAVVLLLDTSGSMEGEAIKSLNEGVRKFKENVCSDPIAKKRVDVALVTFDSEVQVVNEFCPIAQMQTPELIAGGRTNMAEAINVSIDLVKNRTHLYQNLGTPCYKPWIFMITDGASTSAPQEMQSSAEKIREEENKGSRGRLSFWALGVGDYLKDELFSLTKRVLELKNEDFIGIFDWLSESMSVISQSRVGENIQFPVLPDNSRKVEPDRMLDDSYN